jgi:hypothetical protein
MSFKGEGMPDTYSAIKDECAKLKLNAIRVDENTGSGFIIKEIIDLIEKAEFIICDLTHERPNVYYELGYAHGIGNQPLNILLIARDGTTLHFDIAPLRVQYYRSTEHLRTILAANLKEMIRLTREGESVSNLLDQVNAMLVLHQDKGSKEEAKKTLPRKKVKRKK